MRNGDVDRHLHAAFQAARATERARTPAFSRVVAGRDPGSGRRVRAPAWLLAGAATAAGVILVLLLLPRSDSARDELELARRLMAWRSPTAFLLKTPETPLLDSVPRFGFSVPGSPLRALDPGGPLGPPLTRSPWI